MARYRIVCTQQEPCGVENGRAHIVNVGTGSDPDKADTKWTLTEVLAAMDKGDAFYTKSESTDVEAKVEKYDCDQCKHPYIRSHKDRVKDNNLDNLRTCNWK